MRSPSIHQRKLRYSYIIHHSNRSPSSKSTSASYLLTMQRVFRMPIRAGLLVMLVGKSVSYSSSSVDCKSPVCKDTQDMLQLALRGDSSGGGPKVFCPPDRATLGKHSWTLIHTMAAHYPEEPSNQNLYVRLARH